MVERSFSHVSGIPPSARQFYAATVRLSMRVLELGGFRCQTWAGLAQHFAAVAREGNSRIEVLFAPGRISTVPAAVQDSLVSAGVRLLATEMPAGNLCGLIHLCRLMQQERPDIVHVHFVPTAYIGILAARLAGVRTIIWTRHGRLSRSKFSRSWFRVKLAMWLVSHVVCVSDAVRTELSDLGLRKDRMSTIPLGVDLDRYASSRDDAARTAFRTALGIRPNDFVIAVVAQARPEKQTDLVLRALALAVAEPWYERVVVLMVGGGAFDKDNQELARELGVAPHVRFLGVRDDVPRIYSISDVAGLTSLTEGLGLALVEACASGLPVFGTRVGGIPEVCIDGWNGFLFSPGDAHGLETIIAALVNDAELRARMGARGRTLVEERYSLKECVGRLIALYEQYAGPGVESRSGLHAHGRKRNNVVAK